MGARRCTSVHVANTLVNSLVNVLVLVLILAPDSGGSISRGKGPEVDRNHPRAPHQQIRHPTDSLTSFQDHPLSASLTFQNLMWYTTIDVAILPRLQMLVGHDTPASLDPILVMSIGSDGGSAKGYSSRWSNYDGGSNGQK